MKIWNFKYYRTASERNDVEEWIDALAPQVKVKIRTIITYLEIQKVWKKPYAAKLSGTDIWEIRIIYNNVQYRLFGCFEPMENDFTLLVGAIKKNGKYKPSNAINTAEKRRKLILKDEKYTYEYV